MLFLVARRHMAWGLVESRDGERRRRGTKEGVANRIHFKSGRQAPPSSILALFFFLFVFPRLTAVELDKVFFSRTLLRLSSSSIRISILNTFIHVGTYLNTFTSSTLLAKSSDFIASSLTCLFHCQLPRLGPIHRRSPNLKA